MNFFVSQVCGFNALFNSFINRSTYLTKEGESPPHKMRLSELKGQHNFEVFVFKLLGSHDWAVPNWNRPSFLIDSGAELFIWLNSKSMYKVGLMKSSASEPGLSFQYLQFFNTKTDCVDEWVPVVTPPLWRQLSTPIPRWEKYLDPPLT